MKKTRARRLEEIDALIYGMGARLIATPDVEFLLKEVRRLEKLVAKLQDEWGGATGPSSYGRPIVRKTK